MGKLPLAVLLLSTFLIASCKSISTRQAFIAAAPVITTAPVSMAVSAGDTTTLSVVATSSVTPTYQWFRDDVEIPGANESTLEIPNTQVAHAGRYSVRVSNPWGSVTSDEFMLNLFTSEQKTETLTVSDSESVDHHLITFRPGLTVNDILLVNNLDDPQSVQVGTYYQTARNIPATNVLNVGGSDDRPHRFYPASRDMTTDQLTELKLQITNKVAQILLSEGRTIQAIVISWTNPFRISGNSITFVLGTDIAPNSVGCGQGPSLPQGYPLNELYPYTNRSIRPTMMLAGTNFNNVKDLIDRGIASDLSFPTGDLYMVRTTDAVRSVRHTDFSTALETWNTPEGLQSYLINNSAGAAGTNFLQNKTNVLLYHTGLADVQDITTNTFKPGAIADTLTSYSGIITGDSGGQTSALRFLEAGATGSYGTVDEPCNYTSKFPKTTTFLSAYFSGNTLVESYWKSVTSLSQGLFIGEPLARPFGTKLEINSDILSIRTTLLVPGKVYGVYSSDSESGPWHLENEQISITKPQFFTIDNLPTDKPYIKLSEIIDTTDPEITTLSPEANTVISESEVTFTVEASDNSSIVTKVEFYIDGELKSSVTTAPYTYDAKYFDYLPNGNHTLKVIVYDPAGNTLEREQVIVVSHPVLPLPEQASESIVMPLTINGASGMTPTWNYLSMPLVNLPVWEGTIALATGTSISVATEEWTNGQFSAIAGTYSIEIASGSGKGRWSDILSNDTDSLTTRDDLSPWLVPGTSIRIRKYKTLADVFGANNEVGLLSSNGNFATADEIHIYEGSVATKYYYTDNGVTEGWSTEAGTIPDTIPIRPHQPIIVKRKDAATINFNITGSTIVGPYAIPILAGQNFVVMPFRIQLGNSGLYQGLGSLGLDGISGSDYVYFQSGASEFYFPYDGDVNYSGGWYDGSFVLAPTVEFQRGDTLNIVRESGFNSFIWMAIPD